MEDILSFILDAKKLFFHKKYGMVNFLYMFCILVPIILYNNGGCKILFSVANYLPPNAFAITQVWHS